MLNFGLVTAVLGTKTHVAVNATLNKRDIPCETCWIFALLSNGEELLQRAASLFWRCTTV